MIRKWTFNMNIEIALYLQLKHDICVNQSIKSKLNNTHMYWQIRELKRFAVNEFLIDCEFLRFHHHLCNHWKNHMNTTTFTEIPIFHNKILNWELFYHNHVCCAFCFVYYTWSSVWHLCVEMKSYMYKDVNKSLIFSDKKNNNIFKFLLILFCFFFVLMESH